MQAPRAGSRKAQVYDAMMSDGPEAAVKLAATLGLSPSTAKSWIGTWSKSAPAPKPNGQAAGFTPRWVFNSEKQARKAADGQAKNCGSDPDIFVVVKKDNKYAFVPCHLADKFGAERKPGVFHSGDEVYDLSAPNKVGVITKVGAEVSEVRWPGGLVQNITNDYLRLKTPTQKRVSAKKSKRGR